MIKSMNKLKNGISMYECDRCKAEMSNDKRFAIFVAEGLCGAKKKWDLCSRCYKALYNGITKYDTK